MLSRDVLASRLILICTPDDRIAAVAEELARIGAEELQRQSGFAYQRRSRFRALCGFCANMALRSVPCTRCNLSAEFPFPLSKAKFSRSRATRLR